MRPWTVVACVLAATAASGCTGAGEVRVPSRPPRPVEDVDEIIVQLTPPTAVNWDNLPGPDGLQAQIHFFRLDEDLAVTIAGTLEMALYEGRAGPREIEREPPLHVWKYEGDGLRRRLAKTLVGWGYGVRLGWGDRCPKSGSVTLLARYHSPSGGTKTSETIHVPLGPK